MANQRNAGDEEGTPPGATLALRTQTFHCDLFDRCYCKTLKLTGVSGMSAEEQSISDEDAEMQDAEENQEVNQRSCVPPP